MGNEALELTRDLTRREFLHLSGLSMLSLGLPLNWRRSQLELSEGPLARVLEPAAGLYERPYFSSEKLETCHLDDVLPIEMAVLGDVLPEHNRVWYYVNQRGFLHSSSVQPVLNCRNQPLDLAGDELRLAEVSVPYVDAYLKPAGGDASAYRLYYATTHWVSGSSRDASGEVWYRIEDPRVSFAYHAPATALRLVQDDELSPISLEVPASEKHIQVDLERQWLKCYEGSSLCFMTRVSTGCVFDIGDFSTRPGVFPTRIKRASRHMWVSPSEGGYDYPGVPWVNYFNLAGDALHGTYWHNDFGTPHSHGCVNLTPKAAKWIFRWTLPSVPADATEVWVEEGTIVRITS